jgi:hypothetical protein
MNVAVDQPRDDPPPFEIVLLYGHPNRRHVPPHPKNALPANEQMHSPARFRIVQLGIDKEGE